MSPRRLAVALLALAACNRASPPPPPELTTPEDVAARGADGTRYTVTGSVSTITFDNVKFTYPGSRNPALSGVSFEVPAGTMLKRLYTMEREGATKPAMVAEMLSLIVH